MAEIDKSKFLAVGIFVLAVCLAAIELSPNLVFEHLKRSGVSG